MQATSETWKQLWAAGAALEARATIAGTVYADIGTPLIRREAMQERMGVGNVASAALSLAVRTSASIPRSASVVIEARLNDGTTASEWLPQGTFYIARRARDPVTGALALECYDALLKANAVWTPSVGSWPRTMGAVLAELLALLGLSLDNRTAVPSGAACVISEPPAGTTIRDVLGVIAQAGGGNWIVTPANRLRLVPLADVSGAAATAQATDVVAILGGIDVDSAGTVTGVRDTWEGMVTLTGSDSGLVVDVSVAPMLAVEIAQALIGRVYQPYSLTVAIYDPATELGDYVRAGVNGEVASALYSERATLGPAFRGNIAAPGAGETTDEYPYIGGNAKALTLAKAYVAQAVQTLDDSLTQQEIFDRLTDNGAAQGLVLYNGQLYINASYIKSGILTLGGANNVNGELHILDANGNLIGTITKDGIGFQRTNAQTGFFVSPYGSIAVGVKPANLESLDDANSFQALSSGIVKVQNIYIYNTTEGQVASILPVVGGGIAIYGETDTDAIANINPTESIFYSSLYTGGNLSVPYGNISTGDYIYANGDITSHGDVIAHGDVTAGAGVSATTDITAGGDITATGSVFAGTDVSADGNISAGGMITATGDISTDGNVAASGDVSADADITAGGTVTATGDISSGGSISADSDITAGGDISAGGTLYATGDISTNGSITADVDITAYGNIAADGDISSSANITADSDITAGGNISATGALSAGDAATTRDNLRVLDRATKLVSYGSSPSDFADNLQLEVFDITVFQSRNIIVNNGSANFCGLLTRSSQDGYTWAGLLIGANGQLLKVSRNGSGSNVSIVYQ